jgi:hypothetical protein
MEMVALGRKLIESYVVLYFLVLVLEKIIIVMYIASKIVVFQQLFPFFLI